MHRRQRTIPRSARRGQPQVLSPQTPLAEKARGAARKPDWEARYVPDFDSSRAAGGGQAGLEALPPIRTGVEALSPQVCKPHCEFLAAPLTVVRWVPGAGAAAAVAAVGTGDGGSGQDALHFHAVHLERDAVVSRAATEIAHAGKVNDIAASRVSGAVFVASSDGSVRAMQADRWDAPDAALAHVARLPRRGLHAEPAVAAAPLAAARVFAFGAAGTLMVADAAAGAHIGHIRQADPVGFRAAAAVDPDGGFLAVAAGAGGEVTVWDSRAGRGGGGGDACVRRLKHPTRGVLPLCVAVDATQPNFVIAGTASGELCVWDRRGADCLPISRVAVHDGFVWDVQVVASRPGLLLSCGEDASVWLMDYGNAAKRAPTGTVADAWLEAGEYWRAQLAQSDLRDVADSPVLGINSVCAHPQADLPSDKIIPSAIMEREPNEDEGLGNEEALLRALVLDEGGGPRSDGSDSDGDSSDEDPPSSGHDDEGDPGQGSDPLYDERADSEDERWVTRNLIRRPLSAPAPTDAKRPRRSDTEFQLSCPSCFALLCLQCQPHERYEGQFRAIFVQNCVTKDGETLRVRVFEDKNRGSSSAHNVEQAKRNLYRPVACTKCSTEVAVQDADDVYHFCNVLY